MPVRGDSSSKIESLPGGTFTGDIDDVKYLRDKLFSALKVPQSYLSRGEGADEDKSTLAQKDIRFARTIQRLQRSVLSEIEKIGVIHLYTLGFRGDDLVSFTLSLNNPSKIAELQELEHWRTKFDVAAGATEGFFSKRWVATNLFGLTDDEIVRMQREMFFDRKLDAELNAVGEAIEGAAGGGEFGGGDDFAGDEEFDADDDMDMGDTDTDTDAGADVDDVLLTTPPGRRSDSPTIGERKPRKGDKTTTKRSRGKVYTVRGDHGKSLGARKTSMGRTAGNFASSTSIKNTLPGSQDIGLGGLTNGIMESKSTNYKNEESKILQTSQTLQRFAESLAKTDKLELEKKDDGETQ